MKELDEMRESERMQSNHCDNSDSDEDDDDDDDEDDNNFPAPFIMKFSNEKYEIHLSHFVSGMLVAGTAYVVFTRKVTTCAVCVSTFEHDSLLKRNEQQQQKKRSISICSNSFTANMLNCIEFATVFGMQSAAQDNDRRQQQSPTDRYLHTYCRNVNIRSHDVRLHHHSFDVWHDCVHARLERRTQFLFRRLRV